MTPGPRVPDGYHDEAPQRRWDVVLRVFYGALVLMRDDGADPQV